jgi:sulfate transport system ATP-binding protein
MSISLDQVTKRYQGQPVVNDVSLEVTEGEFFVLLGPSGSGKSTLLRSIAGLAPIDHGQIALHGRDVTQIHARDRGVGFVFQHYALFRHMSVAENIEFALRVRRMKSAERRARRQELLRLVALEGMDDRLPAQLSGGQQQRVAVARALAHKPQVLLLDEPFGALDAKIREELRRTIRDVQRELGITTVLVTHDQEEAFGLADRIGVMNLGRLLEVGRPQDLYASPASRFVATFLGAANLMLARQGDEGVRFGDNVVEAVVQGALPPGREREVVTVMRPEELEVATRRDLLNSSYVARGIVEEVQFTGASERLRLSLPEPAEAQWLVGAGDANGRVEVVRTQPERRALPLQVGDFVAIGARRVHVLPTPLSSFVLCVEPETDEQPLLAHPLLVQFATRMKTRVHLQRMQPGDPAPEVGVPVLADGPDIAARAAHLLASGANEVLVLPAGVSAPVPTQVCIHWQGEAARSATLAVAASVLRQLSAEAICLATAPSGPRDNTARSATLRRLLDARSEARAAHGIEMRTELVPGEGVEPLADFVAALPAPMLVLGITNIEDIAGPMAALAGEGRLKPRYTDQGDAPTPHPGWPPPMLLVYRSATA